MNDQFNQQDPRQSDQESTQRPYQPDYYANGQNNGYGGQSGSSGQGGQNNGWQNYDRQWQNGGSYGYQRGNGPYQWNFDQMHQTDHQNRSPKKKNHGLRVFGVILGSIAGLVLVCFAAYGGYVAATGSVPQLSSPTQESQQEPSGEPSVNSVPDVTLEDKPQGESAAASDGGMANTEIYTKCSPSVVGIVSYLGTTSYGYSEQSQGSGIIMSEDGYIITNAHVVEGAMDLEVVLSTGETYDGVVVGSDSQTDLAVVKIVAEGLTAAEFGNSDQLLVGERVVAIGNPGGLQFATSLTVGYVSALNREIAAGDAGYTIECIQTDAAINPGNSGGALINAYGQVVGINSAKIAMEGYEGMGFAIPINDAMPIITDIITNGKVTGRAMLGITAQQVQLEEAQYYGTPLGLRIYSFVEGADIQAKGAKEGDIITHIEGKPVYSFNESAEILQDYAPGDTVTITIYRLDNRGKSSTFDLDIVLMGS